MSEIINYRIYIHTDKGPELIVDDANVRTVIPLVDHLIGLDKIVLVIKHNNLLNQDEPVLYYDDKPEYYSRFCSRIREDYLQLYPEATEFKVEDVKIKSKSKKRR